MFNSCLVLEIKIEQSLELECFYRMHKDKSSMFLESLGRRAAEIGGTVTELLASVLKPAMRETSINMLG